jgi:hypothetical protein
MTYATIVPPGDERPGDLFFERGTSLAAAIIRLSQLSSHNHVGLLLARNQLNSNLWTVAEADSRGFRVKQRALPGGYVVRMPAEYGDLHLDIVAEARALAQTGSRYDWLALLWQAGRFFEKWFLTAWFGSKLKRLVRKNVESKKRLICSEAALLVLRRAGHWPDLIGRFDHLVGYEVSPTDLFRALVGHRDG